MTRKKRSARTSQTASPRASSSASARADEALLLELTGIPTAAGREDRVQAYVDAWLHARRRSLEWKRDRAGNLLIRRRTRTRRAPLLITAHLDHPAFVVTAVEGRDVTLEFRGGVHDPYFEGTAIEIVDANDHPHRARIRSLDADAKPFKTVVARLATARAGVAVGDVGRWRLPAPRIVRGRLKTPACDDLAAAAAALCAFDRIRRRKGQEHVGLLLTVAEEVGFVGAIDAAKSGFIPKSARLLCLENSRSFEDSPIGGGPIVRVGDRISVFDHEMTNRIVEICAAETARDPGYAWQRKLMVGGACEATAFATYGYTSTCVCLPLGNYHNMADIDGVLGGARPARIAPEEIAVADFHGLVRMLELVAREFDRPAVAGALRSRLDDLHDRHRVVLPSGARRR